jgi:triosephosphate isomerase
LKDFGIQWTLLGHSERRTLFNENDELVAEKTAFALS